MTASNTTPPGAGAAHTGAAVRCVFKAKLAAASAGAAASSVQPDTVEKVATGYRLELVAGSATSLWLRAGTEEWQLDNPTDAIQAFVQAFCHPGQELVFRHRSDVITELEVRKASSSNP